MDYTKGELHNHKLTIHIQQDDDEKVVKHTCIANMNPAGTAYQTNYVLAEVNARRLCKCWNCHDDLLKACKLTCTVCFRKKADNCKDCKVGKAIAKAEAQNG